MSLAYLFPGQGAQRPHMLHDLPTSPAVARVIAESRCRTTDLDSAEALKSTGNVQVALLIAGVACARALTEDFGLSPEFVAGHSVGAFAAAVTAGVLTLPEALTAVRLRARSMEQACGQGNWGMAVVNGLPTRTAAEIARQVSTDDDPLWVANINSATQTVFSGTASALRAIADATRRGGALDYKLLDVAVASHCPKQQDTARAVAEHLSTLPRREPTARYLTNTRGRITSSAETILDDLAQAVARPVQWYNGIRLMGELGVTCAVESAPGHVLTRLFSAAVPSATAISVDADGVAVSVRRARTTLQSREPR